MRAVVIEKPGGIEQLSVKQVPEPTPGPGEVLIDVKYAACNWADTEKRKGVYPEPMEYPLVPGSEVFGRIAALGVGVTGFAVGDRVSAIMLWGAQAEKCIALAQLVLPIPEEMPDKIAAVFSVVSVTAYHLLHTAYRLKRGQTVLIHAIGGAVGLMATQIATAIGANAIGTVSHDGKGDQALEYGAKLVINRSKHDFVKAAFDFTDGRGVDLVIDSLGGETGYRSLDALSFFGHLINIGEAENFPKANLRDKLYERSTSFAGYELHHACEFPESWKEGVDYLTNGFIDGKLKLPIVAEYPLKEIREAHRQLESRTVSGKLLLIVNPDLF